MNSLRYLLAAIAALTLIMSIVSPINPGYFAGLNAFADHDEEDVEEHDEEHDDESEEKDDDELVKSLGDNSRAELEVDDDEAELKVEIEDGDLDDGTYDVAFACESPDLDEEFEDALEVDDGEGEFEQDLTLPSGIYSGCEVEVGELSAAFQSFEIMANDDDDEDEDEEDDDNDKNDEDKITRTLGDSSKAVLEIDDDVELQIEIENDDLDSGTYDVEFTCDSPDVDKEFADALEVEDGEGEFEEDLPLTSGTYSGCEVTVGDLSVAFESFTVRANDDDDEEEDDKEDNDHGHESEFKKESELKADEDGAEIKVKVKGLNMTDGSYDAVFACDTPALSVTLDDAFEVEDGEGELEETIGLTDGTYSGCDITVQGTVLASFNAFTISEESEEEQKQKIEEKRKEKNEKIVTIINGTAIHEKHIRQNAASPGEYEPGWEYTLAANGTAAHNVHNGTADHDTDVDIDMAVWKSNNAVILLDVIDGTVEVENQTYTVVLGYALYAIQHDTFRLGALAVDDDGNVFKLKLRGVGDGEFPAESGSIELEFEGSSGPADQFGDWELTMDGTITAG